MIEHEGYNDNSLINDIAIIQLDRDITFIEGYISTINLPEPEDAGLYDQVG